MKLKPIHPPCGKMCPACYEYLKMISRIELGEKILIMKYGSLKEAFRVTLKINASSPSTTDVSPLP